MADTFLKVPCVGISQPIGEFFLCAIPAKSLLEIAYSIPATMKRQEGMFSSIFGTQRVKSASRAKQIGAYIDEGDSTFPNTIILSVNYRDNGEYEEDSKLRWQATTTDGHSYLTIPTNTPLASIIDGQHRLDGFRNVQNLERLKMELPCAVYINLPRPYQARIFATININQKRVDKSLAYELFGYDLNEVNANKWPPDMLGVYLARILEGEKDSPFQGHVRLALLEEEEGRAAGQSKESPWQVSVACLVEGITRLISEKPAADRSALASGLSKDRSELTADNTPLRKLYIDGKDKTLLSIITAYFEAVDELLWHGCREGSFIVRTVGVLALFDILRDALKNDLVNIEKMGDSAKVLLKGVQGIDFSDNFFHASGAGRVRIRNVIKAIVGIPAKTNPEVTAAVQRLVDARGKPR